MVIHLTSAPVPKDIAVESKLKSPLTRIDVQPDRRPHLIEGNAADRAFV